MCSLINNVFSTSDCRPIASNIRAEGLKNTIKTSFMVAGVRADIQMWQLPDTNQKCYFCSKFFIILYYIILYYIILYYIILYYIILYYIILFLREIGGRSSSKVVSFTEGCVTLKCNRKREEYYVCVVFGFLSFSRRSMTILSTVLHFFESPGLEIGY